MGGTGNLPVLAGYQPADSRVELHRERHPAPALRLRRQVAAGHSRVGRATQSKNLEALLKLRVMDRTELILDIFATRARTSEAQMQVELAQLQYMLPRLRRLWTHLERYRTAIGMRGPGETQLETDRRRIFRRRR